MPEKRDTENKKTDQIFHLAEEKLSLSRERVRDGAVTVRRYTTQAEEKISTLLNYETVEIERFPCDKIVDVIPEITERDGVMIIPVVEEEIEIVRRLVLKEEIHIHQITKQKIHEETVTLRKQHINLKREEGDQ